MVIAQMGKNPNFFELGLKERLMGIKGKRKANKKGPGGGFATVRPAGKTAEGRSRPYHAKPT